MARACSVCMESRTWSASFSIHLAVHPSSNPHLIVVPCARTMALEDNVMLLLRLGVSEQASSCCCLLPVSVVDVDGWLAELC